MISHYIEFKVLPDPEFTESTLISALFAKLHRALVEISQGEIGVSFPNSQKTPGDCLRVFASKDRLQQLMAHNWLKGLRDYVSHTELQTVPDSCQYRTVKRVQPKFSGSKLRRSRTKAMAREGLSESEVAERYPASLLQPLGLPFLSFKSLSSMQVMKLYFQQGEVLDKPVTGEFNPYGLSAHATIPWF